MFIRFFCEHDADPTHRTAHIFSAILPQFTAGTRVLLSVDDEGMHIRTNVTIPPPREMLRRIVSWNKRLYLGIVYSFFPFNPAVIEHLSGKRKISL